MFPTASDEQLATLLAVVEETTVIAAHTHLAMDRHVGRWHLLNPGTVGLPLNGVFGASYMLLDGDIHGWRGTLRHVPFDYDPIFKEFERLGFVEACGIVGHLGVEEYRTARMQVYPFIRWHQEYCPSEPQTMAMLESFSRINKWKYIDPAYHVNL